MPETIRITESHWYVTGYEMHIIFSSLSIFTHFFLFFISGTQNVIAINCAWVCCMCVLYSRISAFKMRVRTHTHTNDAMYCQPKWGKCLPEKWINKRSTTKKEFHNNLTVKWHTKLSLFIALVYNVYKYILKPICWFMVRDTIAWFCHMMFAVIGHMRIKCFMLSFARSLALPQFTLRAKWFIQYA